MGERTGAVALLDFVPRVLPWCSVHGRMGRPEGSSSQKNEKGLLQSSCLSSALLPLYIRGSTKLRGAASFEICWSLFWWLKSGNCYWCARRSWIFWQGRLKSLHVVISTEVLKTIFIFPDTFLCSSASLQVFKVFGLAAFNSLHWRGILTSISSIIDMMQVFVRMKKVVVKQW